MYYMLINVYFIGFFSSFVNFRNSGPLNSDSRFSFETQSQFMSTGLELMNFIDHAAHICLTDHKSCPLIAVKEPKCLFG